MDFVVSHSCIIVISGERVRNFRLQTPKGSLSSKVRGDRGQREVNDTADETGRKYSLRGVEILGVPRVANC